MATRPFDIVNYGGTMGGIIASVAAARRGHQVAILEETPFMGGLVPSLGYPDFVSDTSWGISTKFWQDVEAEAIAQGVTEAIYGRHEASGFMRRYIPSWAMTVRDRLLATPGITVVKDIELGGVDIDSTKTLKAVTLTNGDIFTAKQFGEFSYHNGLARKCRVPMTYGREGRSAFNEFNAGVQHDHAVPHSYLITSPRGDRWRYATTPPTGLKQGDVDYKTQADNYRTLLSTRSDRIGMDIRPEGHRPEEFVDFVQECNVRNSQQIKDITSYTGEAAPGLHTTNGNDWEGPSWTYPLLRTKAQRKAYEILLAKRHLGQMYEAATNPAIPAAMRADVLNHGWPATEFQSEYIYRPGFSNAVYVRAPARIFGQSRLDFSDTLLPKRRTKPDPMCQQGYGIDRHGVYFYVTPDGNILEGRLEDPGRGISQIPFSACKPHPGAVTNLVVGIGVSCTDVVMGGLRIEPTWMILGESLGLAQSAAIETNSLVGVMPYAAVQPLLVAAGAKLEGQS